jgi:Ner family transcriptional regulator
MRTKRSAPQGGWSRHDIVAAIRNHGSTLVMLDENNGLAIGSCSRALTVPYPRVDAIIAKFIETPLHELWPDRYDRDGNRVGLLPRRQHPKSEPKSAA